MYLTAATELTNVARSYSVAHMTQNYMERLDSDQTEAALFPTIPLLVMAGAGSGKTSLLTARIAHQIDSGAVPAREMFVSAFTRSAANEMHERIQGLTNCEGLEIGTFHSLMFRLLNGERQAQGKSSYDIVKGFQQKNWFQGMLGPTSRDFPLALNGQYDLGNVMGWISSWKNSVIHHYDDQINTTVEENPRTSDMWAAATLYPSYEAWLASEGRIDFDDMLLKSYDLLASDKNVLARARERWTAFFIDECQPAGTMVLTPEGDVPIETLAVGDRVVAYDQRSQRVGKRGNVINGITRKPYDGELVVVQAGDKRTRYTPNHHCIALLGPGMAGKHLVYLMRRGDSFRIGVSTPKHGARRATAGPIGRMREERADAVWILGAYDTKTEALMEESFAGAKFGIPQQRFVAGSGERYITTQDSLDQFWERMGDLTTQAEQCLEAYGRRLAYPISEWVDGEKKHLLQARTTVIRACNLMDGMVVIDGSEVVGRKVGQYSGDSLAVGAEDSAWKSISVSLEWYEGDVWSLDVDVRHTYIGDGIVTHNCQDTNLVQFKLVELLAPPIDEPNITLVGDTRQALYEFRGARPELLDWFEETYKAKRLDLANNYRCVNGVVKAANELVRGKLDVIDQKSIRGEGAAPQIYEFMDAGEQALAIAEDVREAREKGEQGGDTAVLVRTNAQSAAIESAFVKAGLPYWCNGGGFFDHMEIGDLVAYLRLAHERSNVQALERIINRPTRFLGKAFVAAVAGNAHRYNGDLVQAMRFTDSYNNRKLSTKQRTSAIEMADLIESLTESGGESISPFVSIMRILESTNYMEWLKETTGLSGGVDESRDENISALKDIALTYGSTKGLLNFIDESSRLQMDSPDSTKILTVHRSKGGEWPTVWIANMHGDSFPHKAAQIEGNLLPERRIAYVAFTRAKDNLKLGVTLVNDKGEAVGPSPYITEAGLEMPVGSDIEASIPA